MTGYSFTPPVGEGGRWVVPAIAEVKAAPRANGPEGRPRDAPSQWDRIDWRAQEEQVRRLRARSFKGGQEQGRSRGRKPPELVLRRRANTPGSVRPAAPRNTPRPNAARHGG